MAQPFLVCCRKELVPQIEERLSQNLLGPRFAIAEGGRAQGAGMQNWENRTSLCCDKWLSHSMSFMSLCTLCFVFFSWNVDRKRNNRLAHDSLSGAQRSEVPAKEVPKDDFHRFRWRCITQPERAAARVGHFLFFLVVFGGVGGVKNGEDAQFLCVFVLLEKGVNGRV